MPTLTQITQSIMQDPDNQSFTSQGIEPLFAAPTTARINIVGQAPGIKAQESRLYWNDKSGDRLREWLDVDRDTFYHQVCLQLSQWIFITQGKENRVIYHRAKVSRKKWHPAILANLPNIELTILIGQYAQKYYLPENNLNVTETVHHFRDFLPQFLPLVHPSPRNQIWLKKNPWFEQEIVPTLQKQVKAILSR